VSDPVPPGAIPPAEPTEFLPLGYEEAEGGEMTDAPEMPPEGDDDGDEETPDDE